MDSRVEVSRKCLIVFEEVTEHRLQLYGKFHSLTYYYYYYLIIKKHFQTSQSHFNTKKSFGKKNTQMR